MILCTTQKKNPFNIRMLKYSLPRDKQRESYAKTHCNRIVVQRNGIFLVDAFLSLFIHIPSVMVQWSNHKKEINEFYVFLKSQAQNFKPITNNKSQFFLWVPLHSSCLSFSFSHSIWPFSVAALHHALAVPWNSLSWAVLSLFTSIQYFKVKRLTWNFRFLSESLCFLRSLFLGQIYRFLLFFPSHVLGALKWLSRFKLLYICRSQKFSMALVLAANECCRFFAYHK